MCIYIIVLRQIEILYDYIMLQIHFISPYLRKKLFALLIILIAIYQLLIETANNDDNKNFL